MLLSSISWNDRINLIEGVLPAVLAGLASKAPTSLVAERVALALGADDKQAVSSVLLKMAPKHPLASHTGGTFKAWGRENMRWIWDPGDSTGWSFHTAQVIPERSAVRQGAGAPLAGMNDIDSAYLLDELNAKRDKIDEADNALVLMDWLIQLVEDARDAEPCDPDALELAAEPTADDIFG